MPDTMAPSVIDTVELTRTLVRCESVTPREARALQLLERTLGALGFGCERMDFTQAGADDVANLYSRVGRRGSMTVDFTVRGIQGHVGYPERLDTPLHRLSAIIAALVGEPIDKGSTHFQPTSLQFTTIDVGNKATNIAPGFVKARFNTRFNDLWTSQKLLAHLKELIERASAALGGNGVVEYSNVEVSGES